MAVRSRAPVAMLIALLALLLAACGQPRSVAQQGPVCGSMS